MGSRQVGVRCWVVVQAWVARVGARGGWRTNRSGGCVVGDAECLLSVGPAATRLATGQWFQGRNQRLTTTPLTRLRRPRSATTPRRRRPMGAGWSKRSGSTCQRACDPRHRACSRPVRGAALTNAGPTDLVARGSSLLANQNRVPAGLKPAHRSSARSVRRFQPPAR